MFIILFSNLFKLYFRIFRMNSERAIELCLQRSYHITPLDVLYLSKSSDSHPKPFLEYITRVVDCLPAVQRFVCFFITLLLLNAYQFFFSYKLVFLEFQ